MFTLSGRSDDIHQIGVVFARVGNHVVHGDMTSSSKTSSISAGNRGLEEPQRTRFILVLTSKYLLQLLGDGQIAWRQLGEKVCHYQDDVINNVNSEQYPYHFGGSSDIHAKFHVSTLSAISDEKELH